MTDSIREKIMQNLVDTLESITVGNGYKNTIRGVYRYEQEGNTLADVPCIEIIPMPENIDRSPNPYATCMLSLSIDVWFRHDKQDQPEPTDKYLITFLDDVTKALMVDNTRGGYAIDTIITGNYPFEGVQGQPYVGITISVDIQYRHKINDTTQQ